MYEEILFVDATPSFARVFWKEEEEEVVVVMVEEEQEE